MSTADTSAARSAVSRCAAILATVAAGPQRPLQHLETIKSVRWMLEHGEAMFADSAYKEGGSFADIARARGTTRQTERTMWIRRQARSEIDPFDRYIAMLESTRNEASENLRRRSA